MQLYTLVLLTVAIGSGLACPKRTKSASTSSTSTMTSSTESMMPACGTCPKNLTQGKQTAPEASDAVATFNYTFDANQCIVPSVQCSSIGGIYFVAIFLAEDEDLIYGQECNTVTLPPGAITCNDMGQWVSKDGTVDPVVICSQPAPGDSDTCTIE